MIGRHAQRLVSWSRRAGRRCRPAGFTLIELMIALAVAAILAAIALPAYQDQVRRSRRVDGITFLNEVARAQERWWTKNHTYAEDMTALGYASDTQPSPAGFYAVSVTIPNTCRSGARLTCFTASAVAQGGQAADTACQTLTLTDTGAAGPAGCW